MKRKTAVTPVTLLFALCLTASAQQSPPEPAYRNPTLPVEQRVAEALEMVHRRGGAGRAWVVGDAELDLDGPVQHAGTAWPL